MLSWSLLLLTPTTAARAQETDREVRRILVLFEQHSLLPANIQVAAGFERTLSAAMPAGREIYSEYLDLTRYPGTAHARHLVGLLTAKYRDIPLDLLVVAGPGALSFVLEHGKAFAPEIPVVFGGVTATSLERLDPPQQVHGVVSAFDLRRTVELARRLQPDANRIVVVTGEATFDQAWQQRARDELPGHVGAMDLSFVSNLTFDGFLDMARSLDSRTILVVLTVFEDAEGRRFIPADVTAAMALASGAPTYSVYSTAIGRGALGGHVETFDSIGVAMARLALRVLAGEGEVPRFVENQGGPVVDWRQMRRFGIPESLLPPGTEVLFYEPTAWERYRIQILLIAAVILLQGATIAALMIQRRRGRNMAQQLAQERLELAHLSRASQLGALSGALAHELSQPLTSILSNAEAGVRLIENKPPDLEEITDILQDIAEDDRRAAAIIAQLRRLLVKGETTLEEVDLGQLVSATVSLARSELVARQTRVEIQAGIAGTRVRGNLPQLQQVLLNLLMNASEAMAEIPPAERRIVIDARILADGWRELSVRDRGRGVKPEMRADVFKPFVSTKPDGLGFGLSICRSIVQAHGGRLAFDDAVTGGARVVLSLPPL